MAGMSEWIEHGLTHQWRNEWINIEWVNGWTTRFVKQLQSHTDLHPQTHTPKIHIHIHIQVHAMCGSMVQMC